MKAALLVALATAAAAATSSATSSQTPSVPSNTSCIVSCPGTGCTNQTVYAVNASFTCQTGYAVNAAAIACPSTLGTFEISCVSLANTDEINNVVWASPAAAGAYLNSAAANVGGAFPPTSCVSTCTSRNGVDFGFEAGSGINCMTCPTTTRQTTITSASFLVTCIGDATAQAACLRTVACQVSLTNSVCRVSGVNVTCPTCNSGSKKGLLGLLGLLGLIPLFLCLLLCCIIIFCCCRRAKKTDGEVFVGTFTAPTADICGVEMVSPYCGTGVVGTFAQGSHVVGQPFACP